MCEENPICTHFNQNLHLHRVNTPRKLQKKEETIKKGGWRARRGGKGKRWEPVCPSRHLFPPKQAPDKFKIGHWTSFICQCIHLGITQSNKYDVTNTLTALVDCYFAGTCSRTISSCSPAAGDSQWDWQSPITRKGYDWVATQLAVCAFGAGPAKCRIWKDAGDIGADEDTWQVEIECEK